MIRLLRAIIRKTGSVQVILLSTVIGILASVVMITILDLILKGVVNGTDLLIGGIVAGTLAPSMMGGFIQLSQDLDRSEERLRVLADEDALTKVHNRRYFIRTAELELERAKRYRHSLSILLLDVDNFKGINDRFGHPVGDAALCKVASICKSSIRSVDLVARWGGDEFIVLLPENGRDDAAIVARRICKVVGESALVNAEDSTPVSITVSIGAASLKGNNILFNDLIANADRALYTAKEHKNCIEVEEG